VLGTGIGLIWDRSGGTLLTAHQASFIVWVSVMTFHVLGHLRGALLESWHELRRSSRWRRIRLGLVVASVIVGVGIALVLYPSAAPWTTQNHHAFSHGHPQ
jgi:hypothetical protein